MANCRACGGKLGLDCFNEHDCLQISNSQYYGDEQTIYQLQEYIEVLKYRLEVAGINVPDILITGNPLVLSIPISCENNPMADDLLPF